MSFGSPKRTHCLNPMRYHGAYIENSYCHQSPSTMTQSVGIYDHFKVSPIGHSLLLILAQTQYPLMVESPCSIVAWWIMTINRLVVWFIVDPVHYASHTLIHLPWETHLDDHDKPSLQLGGGVVSTRLLKSMNQLWITYLLPRNLWLVSSV